MSVTPVFLDTITVPVLVRRHRSLPINCPPCEGRGRLEHLTCPMCGGSGEIDQCTRCYCWEPDGTGRCPC